jgi:hypothetical protein
VNQGLNNEAFADGSFVQLSDGVTLPDWWSVLGPAVILVICFSVPYYGLDPVFDFLTVWLCVLRYDLFMLAGQAAIQSYDLDLSFASCMIFRRVDISSPFA